MDEVTKSIQAQRRQMENNVSSSFVGSKYQQKTDAILERHHEDQVEKGKSVPVGTVSNGRKKVAEGKWVPVKKEGSKPSTKTSSKDSGKSLEKINSNFSRKEALANITPKEKEAALKEFVKENGGVKKVQAMDRGKATDMLVDKYVSFYNKKYKD